MCDPVTIGVIGAGLSVVGGLVGAAGSLESGKQQAAGYEDQAAFADRQSVLERQAGAYERSRLQSRNDRALGSMKQQYVSAGIDASSGSAREVIEDSAREAALDEEAILYGATIRADNQRFTARLARRNAQAARTGATFNAISSVIGGVTGATSFMSNRTTLTNPYATAGI